MKEEHNHDNEKALRTSRGASDRETGVLTVLRGLMPRRPLEDRADAERVAELQASRLLELAELTEPPVPSELISRLPRIQVQRDVDLPASGSACWHNGRWLITINSSEPWARQRFSLAHEFKHVIDHPHVWVYERAEINAEAVADYFAACLLMPKRAVKRFWYGGVQQLSALCEVFEVSPPAMARRLQYLGLRSQPQRRLDGNRRGGPTGSSPATYYRLKSLDEVPA